MNPGETVGQAAGMTRDTAGRAAGHVRDNAMPYALIGAGLVWLLAGDRLRGRWNGGSLDDAWDATFDAETESMSSEEARARARERVQRMGRRARGGWSRLLQENPLVLGLAALAAGAIVGAAVPSTEIENEYLGGTRDRLLDKAREMAEQSTEAGTAGA